MKGDRILYGLVLLLVLVSLRTDAQSEAYFARSTPEEESVLSDSILSFINRAEQQVDAMHSFMVIRHGSLIADGWWDPYGPETPHVMHSLSKSFASTAVGLAVDEGLFDLNDLVTSFFPKKVPEDPSWHWNEMRVRDLLTMNTGHIKEPRPSVGEEDWVKLFLESEVEFMPGAIFKYNSMATYMLSAILQKTSGEKLVDFLTPRLFDPLAIKKPEWDTCPMGINTGGWGLHITTEDIAKLGQLYLQEGVWSGNRVLSEQWVAMATSKQVSNGSNPNSDWAQGYGFQFWRSRHNGYRGDGAMGQFCLVLPEKKAVIAITSGTADMGKVMQLVWDILLPGMLDTSLEPNPEALKLLQEKTSKLKLLPVEGKIINPVADAVSNKQYRIVTDSLETKSVSFNFTEGENTIRIFTGDLVETINLGFGEYLKGTLVGQLPNTNGRLKNIAASGGWIEPNTYQARIYFYESPARITYTFLFKDNEVVWNSKLEHSLFGPRTQQQLVGKREH